MNKIFLHVVLLVFSFGFSLFLLKDNFKAQWSIIDDHEIMYFLGGDHKIYLNEIPKTLSKTEVGRFGQSLRFRPSYYFLRIMETFIWKDNPHLWYFARYLILSMFLFTMSYLVSKYFGILIAIAFSLFMMTSAYWADILARLGPAEIYILLGLSFYVIGFYKIFAKKSNTFTYWLFLFLGGLIATGSKENMIVLSIPSLVIVINRIMYKKLDSKIIFPIIHIMFSAIIFTGICIAVYKTGHDIYMNTVNSSKISELLLVGFVKTIRSLKIGWIIFLGLSFYLAQRFQLFNRTGNISLYKYKNILYLSLFLVFVYFIHYVFYSGNWPANGRYDFPGILSKYTFWLVCFYVFAGILKQAYGKVVYFFANLVLLTTLLGYVVYLGFGYLFNAIGLNVNRTIIFTDNLRALLIVSERHSQYPIIIRSENAMDYELVFSLIRYLNYLGIKNSVMLDFEGKNVGNRNDLEERLAEWLVRVSRNGGKLDNTLMYPYVQNKEETNCISILLRDIENEWNCVESVIIQ